MTADVLVHAKEVAAWATDSDDVRYCQSVIVALASRLAAAERVVEAARRVDEDTDGRLTEAQFSLRNELIGYEKAYSSKSDEARVALGLPPYPTMERIGEPTPERCVVGKGGCDSWRGHVEGCTADLNFSNQPKEGDR